MSEQLRRGKQQWRGMSQDDVDELVTGGLLVPVSIDYEAAEAVFDDAGLLAFGEIRLVRKAVDAALGGN